MVEAAFLVASQAERHVEVIALGFEESRCVATIEQDSANTLIAHPSLPIVYLAANREGGTVVSVDVSSGASFEVAGVGNSPCFLLLVDDEGGEDTPTLLLSANYGEGTLSAIRLEDGHVADVASHVSFGFVDRPGTHPLRQNGSHPHWVGRNGDLLVADLGNDVIHEVALHGEK